MNKKNSLNFSIPSFLSPNEDFIKNEQQLDNISKIIEDHLAFLKDQMFCLKIKEFFKDYPEAEQISFSASEEEDQDGRYIDIFVSVDGDLDDEANHFFCKGMSSVDRNDLYEATCTEGLGGEVVIDRNNQEKTFPHFMGEERFKKWHSLYTEENLLNHLPENVVKPKKSNRL